MPVPPEAVAVAVPSCPPLQEASVAEAVTTNGLVVVGSKQIPNSQLSNEPPSWFSSSVMVIVQVPFKSSPSNADNSSFG